MTGIQIILIAGVSAIFIYYALRLRSAFMDMLALFLFFAVAVFFILLPNYTTIIAHKLGVGRGADMLFYCCILLFLFIILKMFAYIRRLEKTVTELVRKQALSNAQNLKEGKEMKPVE
jgi:small membrane protein